MCGRFQFTLDETEKQANWLKQFYPELKSFHHIEGERFPSQAALTIVLEKQRLSASIKKWGVKVEGLPLIINARVETLAKRMSFRNMLERRCVIVTCGFYEWKKEVGQKQKYLIQAKNRYQFLAGIYNDKNEFVILTCAAYGEMANYHERCPVVLNKEEILSYLQLGIIPEGNQSFVYTKCESK